MNGFDINKYTLEEPSGENMLNQAAWKKAIDVSRMQLEYQKEKYFNYYHIDLGLKIFNS